MDDRLREGAMRVCLARTAEAERVSPFEGVIGRVGGGDFAAWRAEQRPEVVIGFPGVVRVWLTEARARRSRGAAYIGLMTERGDAPGCAALEVPHELELELAASLLDRKIHHSLRGRAGQRVEHFVACRWRPGESLPRRR